MQFDRKGNAMIKISQISDWCRPSGYFFIRPMRSLFRFLPAVVFFLLNFQIAALAGGFDGSQPLIGTSDRIIVINQYNIIDNVDHSTAGIPKKFLIDFKTNTLRPSKDSLIRKTITFNRVDHIENKMVMQGIDSGIEGVEDGMAWSLTISKKDGKAVLAASGDGVAYVVFGACTIAK
jgi:hypothetical protein